MTDTEKHFPWMEGQPTKPDVDVLMRAFPPESITPGGWRASDQEIKAHLGRCDQARYRTVYAAWIRRLMKDFSVVVWREKENGFYCPTPEQVFAHTHPTLESTGRKLGKQMRTVAVVKPENELHRVTQDHQGRLLHAMRRELKKARLNVLPSTVPADVPRVSPPKRAGPEAL